MDRRSFLRVAGSGLAAAVANPLVVLERPARPDEDLVHRSASSIARLIREGQVSSEEVVRAHLARIEAVNPRLNAVVQIDDRALADARAADRALRAGEPLGPLHGVPFTIKDSFDTAGLITTAGTPGRASFVPGRDATVVRRLRKAGGILLGKTNTPEMTIGFYTDNAVYGRTRNPYDLARSPGGSSGGAAAIVAAGGSPLDVGSDTAGSIRVPAHFCGIAGLKPTAGRVPRTGHVPRMGHLERLTQVGPLARFVEDLPLALGILAGPDGMDPAIEAVPLGNPMFVQLPQLRGAFFTELGTATVGEDIRKALSRAVEALIGAGVQMQEARPPGMDGESELGLRLVTADGGAWIKRELAAAGTEESPLLRRMTERLAGIESLTPDRMQALLEEWEAFRTEAAGFWTKFDVLICPVSGEPAYLADVPRPKFQYTGVFNLTGWPVAVVRCGSTQNGLPIGLQVVAPPWREDVAIRAARHLEQALGGWRPPDLP